MHVANILSLLLLPILFITTCQDNSRDSAPVTVIENVNGYTFYDDELTEFSAIAFKNGKVYDIQRKGEDSLDFPEGSINRIDGGERFLLPGLIDAHGHVMGLGYQQMDVNLAGFESLDDVLQQVSQYARKYPDLSWIRGRGWNHTRWVINRFPTAGELDQVVGERPVWLNRVDGHAGWANSKAMELAGITKDTEAPEGGKIIRDEEGNPTGVFIDAAMNLIEKEIPERSSEERQLAFAEALEQMKSHGLTSVHDAGVGVDTWNMYMDFADHGRLSTRIYGMISGAGDTFDKLSGEGPVISYEGDMLALRSVKLYSDGALGSRGAAMIESYSDDPGNRGLLFASEEEMTDQILKTASKGYQANVHAIGDRGNRVVLNAFENVRDSLGTQNLRHRIEHAQVVSPEDIPRFKELDIIASMQPTHATSDMNMAEDRVGPQRIKGAYAWKTFVDQGTVVAAGSDFPVEDVNPFFGLYSAITRQDHSGNPEGGWYSEESLTRKQAFRSFTLNAAFAAHQEDVIGSLEPGKWADFILVDRNIFEVPASEIWQTKVLETWLAGEKVFDSKN